MTKFPNKELQELEIKMRSICLKMKLISFLGCCTHLMEPSNHPYHPIRVEVKLEGITMQMGTKEKR